MAHYNAYFRIPETHPLYEKVNQKKYFTLSKKTRWYHRNYDEISKHVHVHGGFTFAELITGKEKYPQGFTKGLWVGWDYAHWMDSMYMSEEEIKEAPKGLQEVWHEIMDIHHKIPSPFLGKRWTEGEVEKEVKEAIDEFTRPFYMKWLVAIWRYFNRTW